MGLLSTFSGAVGFVKRDPGLRKKDNWGNLEWKGEKDRKRDYNGHSPQPRPMGEAVKMESVIIDVIGTPMGILPEHCDLIGGENDSNKT